MTVLSFSLPVPPSSNRYWRIVGAKGRTFLARSKEAMAWLAIAKLLAQKQGATVLTGDLRVTVTWYRARKSGDVDNRAKVLLDALQGICYANDGQVKTFTITREDTDRGHPRLDVVVQPAG